MLSWLIGFFVVVLGYFVVVAINKTAYWRKKNIPGPRQWPLLGVFLDLATNGQGGFDRKYTDRFGRFFGYFDGPVPVLIVSDLNAIRSIMVKDFSHFVNRRAIDINGKVLDDGVSVLKDQRWKDVRSVLVPTFTSGKMRQMNGLISESCRTMTENLGKIADEKKDFEAKKLFGTVTMDVIASTFFGMKVDSQNDPNNEFVKYAHKAFGQQSFANPILIIAFLFPHLAKYLKKIVKLQFIPDDVLQFFLTNTENIMKMRIESKQVRRDFLQLMLNSLEGTTGKKVTITEVTDAVDDHGSDVLSDFVSVAKENNEGLGNHKLTTNEVIAQSIIFFLAGYETTATALSFMIYALATNPDVQDRLRQEIDDSIGEDQEPTYDRVAQVEYLDMVLNEVLRLYPPVARTERECNQDWEYNGIKVEKGTIVGIPIFAIQRDPEYWENPNKFDPERFSKENKDKIKPYSFETFGQGPRNCIGMRFAYFEMKMVIVSILRKFRIVPVAKTEIPLVLKDQGFISAKNGVWVTVERLSS